VLEKLKFCIAAAGVLAIAGISFADMSDSSGVTARLIGMGSLEAGQVVKGENQGDKPIEKVWYQKTYMRLGFNAKVDERTEVTFEGEGTAQYSWSQNPTYPNDLQPLYRFYPYHMEGSYSIGSIENPILRIGVGIFPFKYNPDVRNLGEYLYRTGTYPPTMFNQFDCPFARLMGLKLTSTPLDSLNLSVLFTSESQVLPFCDWGVSAIGDYTFAHAFTIGGGVFLSHLVSTNENYTTPRLPDNLAPIDSTNADSIYYTFRGIKLMGRLTFDPKAFFPSDIFGANDLRIYSEVAVIGLKNFPRYYDELWRRIPVMAGFNIPAFRVLDVAAVEVEWYRWNYANSFTDAQFTGNQEPRPDNALTGLDPVQNELKWSFYVQKRLAKRFSLIGQVAYDHFRLEANTYVQSDSYLGDAMHNHGDWAWFLKCAFDL
jgi:hypothetical protein